MANATVPTARRSTHPTRTTRRPLLGRLTDEKHDGTRNHIKRPVENLAVARADRTPRRIAPLNVLIANLRAVMARGDRAAAALIAALIARVTARPAVAA